jgi:hypothetical protein
VLGGSELLEKCRFEKFASLSVFWLRGVVAIETAFSPMALSLAICQASNLVIGPSTNQITGTSFLSENGPKDQDYEFYEYLPLRFILCNIWKYPFH